MLAQHKKSGKKVALKIVKIGDNPDPARINSVKYEYLLMKKVECDQVIEAYDFEAKAVYETSKDYKRTVWYLALEHAENGDLINLLTEYGPLPERVAKFYFIQLMKALNHLHTNGVSHGDLKPENILFDRDYNLKLWDFGYSSDVKIHHTKKGTTCYIAPEIITQEFFWAPITDIFSAGIILFIMITGRPPFWCADCHDFRYKYFYKNNLKKFWELVSKNRSDETDFSGDFKELINMVLTPDPHLRPSISEILAHRYLNQNVGSLEEAQEFFEWESCYDE